VTDPLYGKRCLAFGAALQSESPRSVWRVAPQNHFKLPILLTHHAAALLMRSRRLPVR